MQSPRRIRGYDRLWLLLALGWLASAAHAQTLSGSALVEALQDGGYYIAMRHASSPRSEPDAASARPGNVDRERQLDEAGIASAAAMGAALRQLEIPVGETWSSPAFRALETFEHLGLGEAESFAQLDSGGRDTAWLLARVATAPASGTNTIIVTHAPNLGDAFGDEASGMADGEALILRPDGASASVVGRIAIEEWPALAER